MWFSVEPQLFRIKSWRTHCSSHENRKLIRVKMKVLHKICIKYCMHVFHMLYMNGVCGPHGELLAVLRRTAHKIAQFWLVFHKMLKYAKMRFSREPQCNSPWEHILWNTTQCFYECFFLLLCLFVKRWNNILTTFHLQSHLKSQACQK